MRYGEIYLYRTKKPTGWSLFRHNAYVGKTRDGKKRHRQHMGNLDTTDRFRKAGKSWTDLSPRRYVIFRMKHCPDWLLSLVEFLAIRLLMPVYNVQMNRGNPRRITPQVATAQRARRDMGHGWANVIRVSYPTVALGLVCLILAGYFAVV